MHILYQKLPRLIRRLHHQFRGLEFIFPTGGHRGVVAWKTREKERRRGAMTINFSSVLGMH